MNLKKTLPKLIALTTKFKCIALFYVLCYIDQNNKKQVPSISKSTQF